MRRLQPVLLILAALIVVACGKQEPTPPAQTASKPAAPAKPAPVVPSAEGQSSPDITAEDFAARVKKIRATLSKAASRARSASA